MLYKSYQLGKFDYNECFFGEGGFLDPKSNEEKHMIAAYVRALAEELAVRNILFNIRPPATVFQTVSAIHWLEPGIGDASTTEKIVRAIEKFSTKFIIYGSDIQTSFLETAQKKLSLLDNVMAVKLLAIDAFSDEWFAKENFYDLALLSHMLYYIKNKLDGTKDGEVESQEKLHRFINKVLMAIKEKGFILSFHDAPCSGRMFRLDMKEDSKISDITLMLTETARYHGKEILNMPMQSKVYFPPITENEIHELKNLENWKKYDDNTPQACWIKKLLFALNILELKNSQGEVIKEGGVASLAKGKGLPKVIDDLMKILQKDEYGYYFLIHAKMQVILNDSTMKSNFEQAFSAVERKIPQIQHEIRELMHKEINFEHRRKSWTPFS